MLQSFKVMGRAKKNYSKNTTGVGGGGGGLNPPPPPPNHHPRLIRVKRIYSLETFTLL